MNDSPTWNILILAIAYLLIGLWLKKKADRKLDVKFIEHAARVGGKHQQSISNYRGRPLRWIKSAANEYQLCSDDALLASLALEYNGRLAGGQAFEGMWITDYRPWWYRTWWYPTCFIYRQTSQLPEATLKSNIWAGRHTAMFADGQNFTFQAGKCCNAADEWLIAFVDRTVVFEPAALQQPHLALLVLVGSAIQMVSLDYSSN